MRESSTNIATNKEWTVIAYLDHWLHETASVRRRPGAIERYESVLRQYLEPVLGPVRLRYFTVQDAQLLLQQYLDQAGPNRTAQVMRILLLAALDQTARDKLALPRPQASAHTRAKP